MFEILKKNKQLKYYRIQNLFNKMHLCEMEIFSTQRLIRIINVKKHLILQTINVMIKNLFE